MTDRTDIDEDAEVRLSGYTLAVVDIDAAEAWYVAHFGLKRIAEFALPPYDLRGRALGAEAGWTLELLERNGAERRTPVAHPLDAALLTGCAHVQWDVADLEQTLDRLAGAGVEVLMPAHPGPGGTVAFITDLEGNVVRLRTPGELPNIPPGPPPGDHT